MPKKIESLIRKIMQSTVYFVDIKKFCNQILKDISPMRISFEEKLADVMKYVVYRKFINKIPLKASMEE